MDTGSVPLLWAIVRVPCEAVDSVSLVADTYVVRVVTPLGTAVQKLAVLR